MILCKINEKKYPILKKEEAKEQIVKISPKFISALKTILDYYQLKDANIIGIGNSLTSGWSAIDQDVTPFILKLQNILKSELEKADIQVNFYNYSTAAKNSNLEILSFLQTNPTEKDVLERFKKDKEYWDKTFYNTPFRNYIDSEHAYSTYPNTDIHFRDCYQENSLSISLINGCTGGFLNAFSKVHNKSHLNVNAFFKEDLLYLKVLLQEIASLQKENQNMMIVGNFPYISTRIGILCNQIIAKMNQRIQEIAFENQAYFFNKNQLAIFQQFENPNTGKNELKIDNHPTMEEQYTVLYHYFSYLTNLLEIHQNNITKNV